MEEVIWQTYLYPWWKPLAYLLGFAALFIGIRLRLTFNVNEWFKERDKRRLINEQRRLVRECSHGWILYPQSKWSQCFLCQALIETAILLLAKRLGQRPMIAYERDGMLSVKEGAEAIYVRNFVGKERK